ncbi:hypothetical protein L207DRAFT_544008 [Hyaloscypha variabilis F]|uniref:Tat pathway signal sequence n=1 Tax=Hyaloscypha variabilis (strain UAMH 11265 / GT02V1 / F) TaxID=1149755 RepID=A0A2J6RPX8_HYAVF|nr:hypothetical protein L207DRAFT_544008 [Hyaloscypha variabilis F]
MFVIAICTSTISFWFGRKWESTSDPSSWVKEITNYSPILDDVPLAYTPTQFNGSLLKENIFRQPASPEVDAAWGTLGVNYRPLIIPSSLAQKSGLAPDQVKINQKYGGGYPANVEGLHHLHCLNLLRQSLWYNYEYYHNLGEGAFKNEEYIVKFHASHCLDIVRQQLMCTVDVEVLGQVWIHPEEPEAYVDFNTKHMCRDFEAVRSWAEERQMPEVVPEDWLQPPELGDRIYEEMP